MLGIVTSDVPADEGHHQPAPKGRVGIGRRKLHRHRQSARPSASRSGHQTHVPGRKRLLRLLPQLRSRRRGVRRTDRVPGNIQAEAHAIEWLDGEVHTAAFFTRGKRDRVGIGNRRRPRKERTTPRRQTFPLARHAARQCAKTGGSDGDEVPARRQIADAVVAQVVGLHRGTRHGNEAHAVSNGPRHRQSHVAADDGVVEVVGDAAENRGALRQAHDDVLDRGPAFESDFNRRIELGPRAVTHTRESGLLDQDRVAAGGQRHKCKPAANVGERGGFDVSVVGGQRYARFDEWTAGAGFDDSPADAFGVLRRGLRPGRCVAGWRSRALRSDGHAERRDTQDDSAYPTAHGLKTRET